LVSYASSGREVFSMAKAVPAPPHAWRKSTIVFGLVSIQVGIGSIEKEDKLEGHYYDKESEEQVTQKYVIVDDEDNITKIVDKPVTGYEVDDKLVFFEKEELSDLSIGLKKVIEVNRFVDEEEVDALYPEKTYNIWPDGPAQTKAFVALATALKEERKAAASTTCLTSSTRLVVLRYSDRVDHLVLQVCSYDDNFLLDRVDAAKSVTADGPQPSKEELEMARLFVTTMSGDFSEFAKSVKDDYQRALKAAAKAKAQGKPVKVGKAAKMPPKADLMAALKASLAQAGGAKKRPRKAAVK
jgi:Ku protein